MTLTDEEIIELYETHARSCGDMGINDFARAVIAAELERLRQQEPCVMVAISDKDECLAMKYRAGSLAEGPHSLYAAPIPPTVTPSQQEALDMCEFIELTAGLKGPTSIIRDFILARPEITGKDALNYIGGSSKGMFSEGEKK